MNDQSERCACPNSSGNIEFACNCGHNIIFLCKLCIVAHLAESRPHIFISLDQARALKDSSFSDKYTSNMLKYMKLKGDIQSYLPNIQSFIEKLTKFRQDIIAYINSSIDQKIAYLMQIEENVISISEEISKNITVSPSQAYDMLSKYETEGLKGVLNEYPLEFIIFEEEVKKAINHMIFIGSHGEFNNDIGYVNEIHGLHEVIDKLQKDKVSLESQLEKANEYIKRLKQDLPYQQDASHQNEVNNKRFRYSITSDPLIIQKDVTNNKEYVYDLKIEFPNENDLYQICELPDYNLLIIRLKQNLRNPTEGWGYARSELVSFTSETYKYARSELVSFTSETYKFNVSTFEVLQLGPMNSPRAGFKMLYWEGYIYTFGGYRSSKPEDSIISERIGYNDHEWEMLPNINKDSGYRGCVPRGSRIYLLGGRLLTYFDTLKLEFHIFESSYKKGFSYGKYAYDDHFLYILRYNEWAVFDDSMENILSSSKLEDSRIRFVKLKNESILGFSYENSCITVYQRFGLRLQVMKKITFDD